LFRYRGRNYPHTLSESELQQWALFCRARLIGECSGAPLNITEYLQAYAELSPEQQLDPAVQAWRHYVHEIEQRYQL
ncbi:MAG TPA: exodeoxyribonuclease I, partial [Gammaproteobacteria bacterium]|nr:exodeoxyribonuclease I [Gammaproteobacteria bacterium]